MPARRRSSCRSLASATGVVSARVDDQDPAVVGILETHEWCDDAAGPLTEALHHLAVEGPGEVEQQQRVPRGGGVDDHVLGAAPAEQLTEGLEDRELLGARRAEIFGEQLEVFLIEAGVGGRVEAALDVLAGRFDRGRSRWWSARAATGGPRRRGRRGRWSTSGPGAAAGELGGDEAGDGGLADPTLAGDEDDAAPGRSSSSIEPSQAPSCERGGAGAGVTVGGLGRAGPRDEGPECPDADEVPGDQRHDGDREPCNDEGCVLKACCWRRGVGLGDDIPGERLGQNTVDHQLLLVDPELVELSSGVGGDGEGALVGSGHEHHGRQGRIWRAATAAA